MNLEPAGFWSRTIPSLGLVSLISSLLTHPAGLETCQTPSSGGPIPYSKCLCIYIHIHIYIYTHTYIYVQSTDTYTHTYILESKKEEGSMGERECMSLSIYIHYLLVLFLWRDTDGVRSMGLAESVLNHSDSSLYQSTNSSYIIY